MPIEGPPLLTAPYLTHGIGVTIALAAGKNSTNPIVTGRTFTAAVASGVTTTKAVIDGQTRAVVL
jgi:hypothetical protein